MAPSGKHAVELIDGHGVKTLVDIPSNQMMSLPHGKKVVIPWGLTGPLGIGPATILGQFHGQLSRDTNLLPITYMEWPNVSDGEKDALVAAIWVCIK